MDSEACEGSYMDVLVRVTEAPCAPRAPALTPPSVILLSPVMRLLVVLAQQILAVVVAVGGAQDGMDMLVESHGWIVEVTQAHGPLVVELDQQHWAMDTV